MSLTPTTACPSAPRKFTITVPATSANIGPGFDVVGLSLSLDLILKVSIDPSNDTAPTLSYEGLSATTVPLDPYKNLITRVALYVLRSHNITSFPPNLHIHVNNQIPFGRGLGSSGAAVVSGVILGSQLGNLNLSNGRLLDYALMVERHPDNVTAALLGGFIGSYLRELSSEDLKVTSIPLAEVLPEYPNDAGESWGRDPPVPPIGIGHYVRFGWSKSVKALAVVPRFELSTASARGVLPTEYSRADLVFNLQRLAVLTTALAQDPPDAHLIYEAMKDRVHQPYRAGLIPGLPEVLSSHTPDTHPGLLGICLSGAGPTILALTTHNFDAIGESIKIKFKEFGVDVDYMVLEVGGEGKGGRVEEGV